MMQRMALIALALSLAVPSALAQHQPYSGLEARAVKALSDEQIADLQAGRGMGFALAAELNGYPGPMHLLELADRIELSPFQRKQIEDMFHAMRAETIPLGKRLISQESELDHQFASRTVTPESLARKVSAIGTTQAELRGAHLRYHLLTIEVLSPEQVHHYNELRGYTGDGHSGGHGHRHH